MLDMKVDEAFRDLLDSQSYHITIIGLTVTFSTFQRLDL